MITAQPIPRVEEKIQCEDATKASAIMTYSQSQFLDVFAKLKSKGVIATDLDFAQKFMMAFADHDADYCVPIELLVEFKVYDSKGHAKRALRKNFVEGPDYKTGIGFLPPEAKTQTSPIESTDHLSFTSQGGRPRQILNLTKDCFKAMCMRANSEIGKTVRRYYLDLEKVAETCIRINVLQHERALLQEIETDKQLIAKLKSTRPAKTRKVPDFPDGCWIYINVTETYVTKGEFKPEKSSDLKATFQQYNRAAPARFIYFRRLEDKAQMSAAETLMFTKIDSAL